jgi:hypothetical protein
MPIAKTAFIDESLCVRDWVLTHARILLKANHGEAGPGWIDAAIAAALEVNPATVARVRMPYVAAGLDAAVYRKRPNASTR